MEWGKTPELQFDPGSHADLAINELEPIQVRLTQVKTGWAKRWCGSAGLRF
jgi:hypothetical protein